MKKADSFDFARRLVKALAIQFGSTCEVVLHDLTGDDLDHTIIAIENGHISGRSIGDGPSKIALEAIHDAEETHSDKLSYLTKTRDGKILKSSTIFLRDENGKAIGVLAINNDITLTVAGEHALHSYNTSLQSTKEPEPISTNVADLLDSLIDQSIRMVGKPAALMDKAEKVRAIRFLNDSGAFLITKSGPKVCQIFGISKYTLYSYLDEAKQSASDDGQAASGD
jgi:predicted transcriptional regulator YheO